MTSGQASPASGHKLSGLERRFRRSLTAIVLLSALPNLLVIGGALAVWLSFDSIMPSRSMASLLGLALLALIAIGFYGFFIAMRARVLIDLAGAVEMTISPRIPAAIHHIAVNGGGSGDGLQPIDDLDAVRSFLSAPAAGALFDLPWAVLALCFLFVAHLWLGVVGLVAILIAAGLCLMAERKGQQQADWLSEAQAYRRLVADEHRRHAEAIQGLGLTTRFENRWRSLERRILSVHRQRNREITGLSSGSAVLQLAFPLMALVAGLSLAFDDRASTGVIVAAVFLLFEMMIPVERVVANWNGLIAARTAWGRLKQLFPILETPAVTTALPAPRSQLETGQLAICAPGHTKPLVQNIGFRLQAGESLGVVGASASGKTVLMRSLAGIWPPAYGEIRLDGATLDQWDQQELARHVGYLPQNVELLNGTIGQNIARFDPEATPEEVIAAAKAAGIHELVLRLPEGYQTHVGRDGNLLTPGVRQRVGLARALFRDPFLVILDDPNSQVDPEGDEALGVAIQAIRERKGIVVMVTYRHNLLRFVNHVMIMRNGMMGAFGPADRMLKRIDVPLDDPETPPAIAMQGNA